MWLRHSSSSVHVPLLKFCKKVRGGVIQVANWVLVHRSGTLWAVGQIKQALHSSSSTLLIVLKFNIHDTIYRPTEHLQHDDHSFTQHASSYYCSDCNNCKAHIIPDLLFHLSASLLTTLDTPTRHDHLRPHLCQMECSPVANAWGRIGYTRDIVQLACSSTALTSAIRAPHFA